MVSNVLENWLLFRFWFYILCFSVLLRCLVNRLWWLLELFSSSIFIGGVLLSSLLLCSGLIICIGLWFSVGC